jgi:hypothetical protein
MPVQIDIVGLPKVVDTKTPSSVGDVLPLSFRQASHRGAPKLEMTQGLGLAIALRGAGTHTNHRASPKRRTDAMASVVSDGCGRTTGR